MQKRGESQERGYIVVEAAIILPLAILSALLLVYLSLFLFQRANLQSCLETALIYYKNTVTDTYVVKLHTAGSGLYRDRQFLFSQRTSKSL